MAGIVVKPRSRIFHGHDWVYGADILKTFGNPAPGDVISLKDGRDRSLGSAIYNPQSQIVARRFSRRKQELDLEFFKRRIALAISYREKAGANHNPGRLVWSESDGLPGLIVDRYDTQLVVQTLTLGMDQRKNLIVQALHELFTPTAIIERNDAPIRKAEGMQLISGTLSGENNPKTSVEVCGIRFELDLLSGHKTGFYLDQVDSYKAVAAHARGLRVLDCFSSQGAFAIACAHAGAASVTAVEISSDLVKSIDQNALLNQVTITTEEANVFDYLADQIAGEGQFDLIVLDPPSFTKSKDSLSGARRGYKEIHLRALQLLAPDGFLATFTCSHHVSREMFLEIIVDACVDAKRSVRVIKYLTQPLDHPILPQIPETEYLKGYLLQVVPGR